MIKHKIELNLILFSCDIFNCLCTHYAFQFEFKCCQVAELASFLSPKTPFCDVRRAAKKPLASIHHYIKFLMNPTSPQYYFRVNMLNGAQK